MANATRSAVIPCLLYQDAPAAIDWLCATFGFERHLVVPGPDATIAHAQLTFAGGMIMLGSAQPGNEYRQAMKRPAEVGGFNTQSICVTTPDPDAVYQRVQAAGASVILEIKDEDYGGRGFTCRDLEGHIWSFGSYNPWNQG